MELCPAARIKRVFIPVQILSLTQATLCHLLPYLIMALALSPKKLKCRLMKEVSNGVAIYCIATEL